MQPKHWGSGGRGIEIWKPAGVNFLGRETDIKKERKKKEEEKEKRERGEGKEEGKRK